MLVQKKDTEEIFALKSIRKEDIIDKDQIEHTKTERRILEYIKKNFFFVSFFKRKSNVNLGRSSLFGFP